MMRLHRVRLLISRCGWLALLLSFLSSAVAVAQTTPAWEAFDRGAVPGTTGTASTDCCPYGCSWIQTKHAVNCGPEELFYYPCDCDEGCYGLMHQFPCTRSDENFSCISGAHPTECCLTARILDCGNCNQQKCCYCLPGCADCNDPLCITCSYWSCYQSEPAWGGVPCLFVIH